MAGPLYANNVAGLLAANIGPSDTAILLGSGQGAAFPALVGGNYYYAMLVHQATGINEVVKVTGKSADTLTVVRGQDNSAAASFNTGSLVELRAVAQTLRDLDYRNAMGVASGLATLDAGVKLPDAQLSANVPLLSAGKLNIAWIPDAVAMDADLAAYLPLAGGSISGNLAIVGNLTVDTGGAGAARLNVGNDAYFTDINVANAIGLRGVANAGIGSLYLGNTGHFIGWNGSIMVVDGYQIWTVQNFDPNTKAAQTNPYIAGQIRCTGQVYVDSGRVQSGGGDLVLGATGGAIYLRPHSVDNGGNQGIINASGLAQFVDVQSYSDKSMKKSIRRRYARTELLELIQFKDWKLKSDGRFGLGVVAQDLLPHAPEYVGTGADGKLSVDYAGLALELALGLGTRLQRIEAALNLKVK